MYVCTILNKIYFCITVIFLIFAIYIFTLYIPIHIPFISYKKLGDINSELPTLYYDRCTTIKLNDPSQLALDTLSIENYVNIMHTPGYDLLYLPCGYNLSDRELATLNLAKYADARNIYIAAIYNCDILCSKNQLWHVVATTLGYNTAITILPRTWQTNNTQDIQNFKKHYLAQQCAGGSGGVLCQTYILKKNIQGKRGLLLLHKLSDIMSHISQYVVIQHYMTDIYKINGRKLNLRLYIVITINNSGQEWYLYKYGKCIYTNQKSPDIITDKNIKNQEQHFTSLNLDADQVYIKEGLPESLSDLAKYINMIAANSDNDINKWDKVWYKIQIALSKVMMAYLALGMDGLQMRPNVGNGNCAFQLFGVDIILDNKQIPYILEFNKGPEMQYKSPGDKKLKQTLMMDVFKLGCGRLRLPSSESENNLAKWIKLSSTTMLTQ